MSTDSIPLSELESTPSAKFTNIGDSYIGTITSMVERQQTDAATKRPQTFEDGSPRMQWVITIETRNGERLALYAKGGKFAAVQGEGESMLSALGTAVRAAGADRVEVGAELAVAFTGLGPTSMGKSAPKLYRAQYRPPVAVPQSLPVDLFTQS